jgi:hypothetical protein
LTFAEEIDLKMDAILKLVFDNFFLLFAFALFWNVVGVAFMLWKRKRRGLVLPKVSDPDVVFSERFASGSSHKSWMTRLGGASNCLTVVVTRSQLAITTFFPFTAFAGTYDLEHLIPISDITNLTPKGRITELEFQKSDGTRRKLSLRLRDTAGFLRALQKQKNSEQDAPSNGG